MTQTLFKAAANWSGSYTVTYEFKTNIVTRADQTEQRIARRRSPRKTIEFKTTVSGGRAALLRGQLVRAPTADSILAEETESVALAASTVVGSTILYLESPAAWAVSGALLVLGRSADMELVTVDHADGNTVFLSAAVLHAWPMGAPVCPGRVGRIESGQAIDRKTSGVFEAGIRFVEQPASEAFPSPDDPMFVAPETFHGVDLFTRRPNWGRSLTATYSGVLATVDYGFGVVADIVDSDLNTQVYQQSYIGRNRAEAKAVVDLFRRVRGQQGVFYAPTWDRDFEVLLPYGPGMQTLRVDGSDFFQAYSDDRVFRNIVAVLASGCVPLNVNRIALAANGDSLIVLAQPLPNSITPDAVLMWCWLPMFRMSSDQLPVEWLTDRVAQFSLSMQTVPDAFDEIRIQDHRICIGGNYVTLHFVAAK